MHDGRRRWGTYGQHFSISNILKSPKNSQKTHKKTLLKPLKKLSKHPQKTIKNLKKHVQKTAR
jgi:hypothetical protein